MTKSIGLNASENRPLQLPRRGKLRRVSRLAAERRAQFMRSDVRRGTSAKPEMMSVESPGEASARTQEKIATLRVQASIVAAMAGMLAFFHAPLSAALASLFG
jgi:hypothetical protein